MHIPMRYMADLPPTNAKETGNTSCSFLYRSSESEMKSMPYMVSIVMYMLLVNIVIVRIIEYTMYTNVGCSSKIQTLYVTSQVPLKLSFTTMEDSHPLYYFL